MQKRTVWAAAWLSACTVLTTAAAFGQPPQAGAPAAQDGGAGRGGRGDQGRGGQGRGAQGAQAERPEAAGVAVDPAAVARGQQSYRQHCAFCHGADGRGASGPELIRALVLQQDKSGEELGRFLKAGRPDRGMPAFTGFTAAEEADLAAFLHSAIADARRRPSFNPELILVGDAKAGEAYFNGAGRCSACHSPTGSFKGIGAKYDPATIQERVVFPRGRGATPPPITVRVALPSGQASSGQLVSVSDFSVTLVDAAGVRRTFARERDVPKVEITDPLQAHLDMYLKYTDKDMHDVTAYLVTLK